MGEVLKKFGRYFLLDHIAQGGMAEIYRARLASVDGAGRLLVIKKVQAGYGTNTEFLQMFKSEIKVTMGFNHPNIVQLYDFGEEQNQPYIAMEFVDGKNLRQFMTRFTELKQGFPVELACHMIEQSACGLHYAHSFKDKITGQSLNIVHRDISPQNILISYEGQVKVIDFGIAKATVNMESTRAGVIKGKPSYLSPEQISGETLDGRSDIFSLGIVFWELLCGRKLFPGENDLAVLKLIESCQTHVKPPSTINPKVPNELDYIVLKALAKQREKRFQTAEEFQRALRKFMASFRPEFDPAEISYHAKDLFKDEIVEDRKRIQRLNDRVEQLLAATHPSKVPVFDVGGPIPEIHEEDTTVVEQRKAAAKNAGAGAGFGAAGMNPPPIPSGAKPGSNGGSKKGGVEVELDPTPIRLRYKANNKERDHGSGSSKSKGQRDYLPPRNHIQASGRKIAMPSMLGMAAAVVGVVVIGPQYGIKIPVVSNAVEKFFSTGEGVHGAPALSSIEAAPADPIDPTRAPASVIINLRVNVQPSGPQTAVLLNGRRLDPNNPVAQVKLDSPLELSAERVGYRPYKNEFFLDSKTYGGKPETIKEISLDPLKFGFISIHTTPNADAVTVVDGKPWIRKTPVENEKLPVGTYTIHLKNELIGLEKVISVKIDDSHIATVDERLNLKN